MQPKSMRVNPYKIFGEKYLKEFFKKNHLFTFHHIQNFKFPCFTLLPLLLFLFKKLIMILYKKAGK